MDLPRSDAVQTVSAGGVGGPGWMDIHGVGAAILAAGATGLLAVAVAWTCVDGRSTSGAARPWAVAAILSVALAFAASRGDRLSMGGTAARVMVRFAGIAFLASAAVVVARAARLRRRGEALASTVASSVDGAVEELQSGADPMVGIFSGRIGADGAVTSPAGVACAFYEATVRECGIPDGAGRILAQERAFRPLVWIRGERAHASVAFSPRAVHVAEEVRRCSVAPLELATAGQARAEGAPPSDAVSHERVGRIGESCFVFGRLDRGDPPGSYVIRGVGGGPATILVGVSHAALGRSWRMRSWQHFGAAALLTCMAAWLLAP